MALIEARYEHGQLTTLMRRATLRQIGAKGERALGEGIRDGAEKVRQRAVRNVSGYPVNYTGGAFRVQVKTGALKGAIESEWPYGDHLTARVFVNGSHTSTSSTGGYMGKPTPVSKYAASIEHGHREIDLKKTMMGKTVPFFGARSSSARGPFAATGLREVKHFTLTPTPGGLGFGGSDQVMNVGSAWHSDRLDKKLHDRGKRSMAFARKRTSSGGSYFIAFRKVGKKGWIIPEAKPRPFMAAAASASRDDVRRLIGGKVRSILAEG